MLKSFVIHSLIAVASCTKFQASSGHVVCGLKEVDIVVTDASIERKIVAMLEAAGIKVIVAS